MNPYLAPTSDQVTDSLGEVIVDLPPQRPWKQQVGEMRLMAAVLEDAIAILRKRPRSRAGREAREWMLSRDMSYPFSYERICEALDLDADTVRQGIAVSGTLVHMPVRTFVPTPFAQSA